MSAAHPGATALFDPSRPLVDEELLRLAASRAFARSARAHGFLRHLVDRTLARDSAALREMALGVAIFHRSAQRFDPRQDSIVRVEARRLRQKLARYYADEGADARLQFALPTGGYQVQFQLRTVAGLDAAPRSSIAVVELIALRSDEQRPLLAAINRELTGALARLNGIRVVPCREPAASDAERRRVARQLATETVLSGSVGFDADSVAIALQVQRAEDASLVWSGEVRCALAAALGHVETLARGVIGALHREAEARSLRRITLSGRLPYVRAPASDEARDLLHRSFWCLRSPSPANCQMAVSLLERALTFGEDPVALAALGYAWVGAVGLTAVPAAAGMQAARRALERAIELDPENGSAHGSLGTVRHAYEHDWPRAEASLLAALRFEPGRAGAHSRYGWSLMFNRRYAEAHAAYAEARRLDPVDLTLRAHQALIWLYERDYGRAQAELQRVLELDPSHLVAAALQAALHLYAGDLRAGHNAYAQLLQRYPALSIGHCGLAQAHALLGERAAALAELQWLERACAANQAPPYQLAMVHARLSHACGDGWVTEPVGAAAKAPATAPATATAAAFAALDESGRCGDFNFLCAAVDPAFDHLRRDARFDTLLRQHGLGHLASP